MYYNFIICYEFALSFTFKLKSDIHLTHYVRKEI